MELELPPIVLISQSKARRQLLALLGFDFSMEIAHNVETEWKSGQSPEVYTIEQARLKTHSKRYNQNHKALFIGIDTIVWYNNRAIGKPKNRKHQKQMIYDLCDSWHQVYSGVSLLEIDGKRGVIKEKTFSCITHIEIGKPISSVIDTYIDSGQGLDKAGGYGIQDILGVVMVRQIRGDYHNVMGFPLYSFYHIMRKLYQK